MFHRFSTVCQGPGICPAFAISLFLSVLWWNSKIHKMANYFSLLINTRSGFWTGFGNPFVSQSYKAQSVGGYRIHRLHLCRRVKLPQWVSCGFRIYKLHLCRGVKFSHRVANGPVGWGCRMQRLHLCRRVKLPQRVSYESSRLGL